jgi:hypothetical protein
MILITFSPSTPSPNPLDVDELSVGRRVLPLAVTAALGCGLPTLAVAQVFPPEINLSDLAVDSNEFGFVLNGEAANDFSGSVSAAGDINGDGIGDLVIGAYRASPNGSESGRSYVVFGSHTSLPNPFELSELDGTNGFAMDGESVGDRLGHSVSAAGDVNGDGFGDIIVGAARADANGISEAGRSYLVFGTNSGLPDPLDLSTLNGLNGTFLNGESVRDFSGVYVSAAGDVNGDGIDDLILGATGADPKGNSNAGRSYVVFGSEFGLPNPINLSTLDGIHGFVLNGEAAGDRSGVSVSTAGDVNGDGIGDLIIGAPDAEPNGKSFAGRSYVIFGSMSNSPDPINLSTLDGTNGFVLNGEAAGDRSGVSVSGAGDINGDGISDVIIGADDADPEGVTGAGRSYVVFGSKSGWASSFELSNVDGLNGIVLDGEVLQDFFGSSVSAAGDVNGDGIGDLVVGARGADTNGGFSGRSYVVFGSRTSFPSPFDLSTLNGVNGFVLNGEESSDYSGVSVSAAGDINGDGIDDLIVGAREANPDGTSNAGRSYVIFGRAARDLVVTKTNGQGFVDTGMLTTWFIGVRNPTGAANYGARLEDLVPAGVTGATWTCSAFDGAVCANASGSGGIDEIVDLPAGASLLYEFTATVTAVEGESVSNTATITLAAGQTDINPADNSATDTDPVGLFIDGFETE